MCDANRKACARATAFLKRNDSPPKFKSICFYEKDEFEAWENTKLLLVVQVVNCKLFRTFDSFSIHRPLNGKAPPAIQLVGAVLVLSYVG